MYHRNPGRSEHRPDQISTPLRPCQDQQDGLYQKRLIAKWSRQREGQGEVVYLNAEEEDHMVVRPGQCQVDDKGNFINDRVKCREQGDFPEYEPDRIQYMDVAPNQIVGFASMIPFLEHDDVTMPSWVSNMQRQAVPLLRRMRLVGTGLEQNRCPPTLRCHQHERQWWPCRICGCRMIHIRYDRDEKSRLPEL